MAPARAMRYALRMTAGLCSLTGRTNGAGRPLGMARRRCRDPTAFSTKPNLAAGEPAERLGEAL